MKEAYSTLADTSAAVKSIVATESFSSDLDEILFAAQDVLSKDRMICEGFAVTTDLSVGARLLQQSLDISTLRECGENEEYLRVLRMSNRETCNAMDASIRAISPFDIVHLK